jgi:hypothetical protein
MLGILHGESRPGRTLARRAAGKAKRRAFTPVLQHEKKTQHSTNLCDLLLLLLLLLLFGRAGGGLAYRPPPKPGRAAQAERPGARDEPGEGTARRSLPRGERRGWLRPDPARRGGRGPARERSSRARRATRRKESEAKRSGAALAAAWRARSGSEDTSPPGGDNGAAFRAQRGETWPSEASSAYSVCRVYLWFFVWYIEMGCIYGFWFTPRSPMVFGLFWLHCCLALALLAIG